MLTSQSLHKISLEEFCDFYRESVIQKEAETIIGKVLEQQFINHKDSLKYNMSAIAASYHAPIMHKLKRRLNVTSIALIDGYLCIDWSLGAQV